MAYERTKRAEVYAAIDEERDYQDARWSEPRRTVAEHILFMEHHLVLARQYATTDENDVNALDYLRKVTALGVACMESNGLIPRNSFQVAQAREVLADRKPKFPQLDSAGVEGARITGKEQLEKKPHKGRITNWHKFDCGDHGLGYVVWGTFVDHQVFAGEYGHTSYVVKHDPSTGEIETRNSRYTLVGPARALGED